MFTLRPLTQEDGELVQRHRHRMFLEAGRTERDLAALEWPFRRWLAIQLAQGTYIGLVAEALGRPIGAIGVMILDWPPHPNHPADPRRGYLLNLFVEPEHRKVGVGRALVLAAQEELAGQGVRYAILHPTRAARPLYEELGWVQTGELARTLPSRSGSPAALAQ